MNTMPVVIRMLDGDGHFHRLESEPIRDTRQFAVVPLVAEVPTIRAAGGSPQALVHPETTP
jgi:hypothetical protein